MDESILEGLGPDPLEGKHWEQLHPKQREATLTEFSRLQDPQLHEIKLQKEAYLANLELDKGKKQKLPEDKLEPLKTAAASARSNLERFKTEPEHAEAVRSGFSFDAGTSRLASDVERSMQVARHHSRPGEGVLHLPQGQDFYDSAFDTTAKIAANTLGNDTSAIRRVMAGGSMLSAMTSPVQEFRGTRGGAEILAHGSDLGFLITPQSSASLLERFQKMKGRDRDEALAFHEKVIAPLGHGTGKYLSFEQMNPATMAHALSSFKQIEGFDQLRDAGLQGDHLLLSSALDFQKSLGTGGFAKGFDALRTMQGAGQLKDSYSQYKIPSYTRDKARRQSPTFRRAVRHHTGIATHGTDWLKVHPEAFDEIRESYSRERHLWDDPSGTMDIWASRAASGLPDSTSGLLGDTIRPENILTIPDVARASWSERTTSLPGFGSRPGAAVRPNPEMGERGAPFVGKPEISYSLLEGMLGEAGKRHSVHVPGVGHIPMPPSEVQQIAWPVTQGMNPKAIGSGKPDVVRLDPSLPRDQQVNAAPDPYLERPMGAAASIPEEAPKKKKSDSDKKKSGKSS